MDSTPDSANTTATRFSQIRPPPPARRLDRTPTVGDVPGDQDGEQCGDAHGRDRHDQRERPRAPRTDIVQQPDEQHRCDGEPRCQSAIHPERGPDINDRLVARNRRRHDVVGEQQDRPHGAQGRVQQTAGRVHAAPVRIDTADDRVGPADDEDEPADGGDEIRRRHPGVEKSQPEHVEPAGAQVAEEHRTGQEPLQVTGTIVTNEHEGFRAGNSPTEQTTRHDSATTPTLANTYGTGNRASPRPRTHVWGSQSAPHDRAREPRTGRAGRAPSRGVKQKAAPRARSRSITQRLDRLLDDVLSAGESAPVHRGPARAACLARERTRRRAGRSDSRRW